ncbi:hypothetical protein RJ641_002384 [Dillenia turbinata]|uniref:Pectate lyase n=1 Tax=Dillenia turbinata TaxID=194707 RepID=A0AAN8ZFK8_9MAGN
MLLGYNDQYTADKIMRVTIVYNHFGSGLVQRMPRVRFGCAHVANNKYDGWLIADPTILSEGNYFTAPNDPYFKQVTKIDTDAYRKNWKWRSSRDIFQNGAYFVPSGSGTCSPDYTPAQAPEGLVPALASDAGTRSSMSQYQIHKHRLLLKHLDTEGNALSLDSKNSKNFHVKLKHTRANGDRVRRMINVLQARTAFFELSQISRDPSSHNWVTWKHWLGLLLPKLPPRT